MTSTRWPGRSGLGKAYTSVMSAMGSDSARGPEMWSDIGLVGGLVEQRLERRVLQRLGGIRVIEHLLEGRVDTLRLATLLDRAAVVAGIGGRGLLRAENEGLHRRQVRQAVVALRGTKDPIEELEGRPRGEEVLHVGVPRAVEARDERQPRVVVEQYEPRLVNRRDRHPVVPWPVAGGVLQVAEGGPQRLAVTGLDPEEQAELAR